MVGEENWEKCAGTIRTTVSGMYSDMAEVMTAAEAHDGQGVQPSLDEKAECMEVDPATSPTASSSVYNMLVRCIGTEAATIVSVTALTELKGGAGFTSSTAGRT